MLHIGPGAAQFSSDPPGNHKFDPDSPENSWDPDPGLKNNARIGSRSRHDPRASGAPGWKLFFDLGRVEKQLEWRALRCISGLVRTGKSDDDAGIDRVLLIAALATSAELESSVHLLWLAQETSETC